MKQVYTAESIQDIKRILREKQAQWTISFFIKYIIIKSEIFFINFLLNIFQFILFKNTIPLKKDIKTIVIYSVGILGDNVVRLPAIRAIKQAYPESTLIVINNYQKWNPNVPKQLFENLPYVDKLILIKDNPIQRKGFNVIYNKNEMEELKCDLFINLSPLGPRGLLGAVIKEIILAKKLKAKYAFGFKIYSLQNLKQINPIKHRIANFNYPRLPEEILGNLHLTIDYSKIVFPSSNLTAMKVEAQLKDLNISSDNYAILHPGASLACQRWPASRYAEIAIYLKKHYGLVSIITGVESEKNIVNDVVDEANGCAISLAGKTSLIETIELIQKAKIIISNDTGLLHLASIQNIPTLGIFSSRDTPKWWFPLGEKKYIIIGFSEDSFRYSKGDNISDLLAIEIDDVQEIIDKMFTQFKIVDTKGI